MDMMMDIDTPVDPRLTGGIDMNVPRPAPMQLDDGIDYDHDYDDAASEAPSNASSDDLELAANIARYDAQREAFVSQHRGVSQYPPPGQHRPHHHQPYVPSDIIHKVGNRTKTTKGRKLGPRKAAKPTPDILFRLSLAKEAFERKDYDETIAIVSEIIRINSETYAAWTLLSTVHDELGDRQKALTCMLSAALLVPKNVPYWISTALYSLHGVEDMDDGPEKDEALRHAHMCYSCALLADKTNIEARTGKADVMMMQGRAGLALIQYQRALSYKPLNIRTVRNTADVALDCKDARKGAEVAMKAYRYLIDHLQAAGTFEAEEGRFEWSDLRIYLEFFGILEQWREGAQQLKEVARWLMGRRDEVFWENYVDDDREWDLYDTRRVEALEFEPARYPQDTYGAGLPFDLRAKLYVYRCKAGLNYEGMVHLALLDPTAPTAVDDFIDFPDCLKDIANTLLEGENAERALEYIGIYRQIADVSGDIAVDADLLVTQGRCHIILGDKAAAEECFIAAIEDEQDHIEARVQLANMYEGEEVQEGREEAFLLVRQALNLELRADGKPRRRRGPYGPRKPRAKKDGQTPRKSNYMPRRLLNAEKRKQQELELQAVATKNYQLVEEAKARLDAGDEDARPTWMAAAKDLLDDFRSFKEFYPWDKYIRYLGYGETADSTNTATPARNTKLAAMAARLQSHLVPDADATANPDTTSPNQPPAPKMPVKTLPPDHRGIPFSTWLDLFLSYALALAHSGHRHEAYIVCHAARDSVVWSAPDHTFLIHIAWASCAIHAGDEETCVAVARYFMRDYRPGTDAYRMFAAMCRVCQTPVSWYTSGPAQKFILRQIKTMDNIHTRTRGEIGLDVCLLTIYGHILFSTTSYVYALSYFARAASLDPGNELVNLSTGLAYLHYALKRQATNRQYLLVQAFAFLMRYYGDRLAGARGMGERMEAHFNVARAYSLVGLGNLAVVYYRRVLEEAAGEVGSAVGREDLVVEAAYNVRTMCYLLGDVEGARAVTERWMVL